MLIPSLLPTWASRYRNPADRANQTWRLILALALSFSLLPPASAGYFGKKAIEFEQPGGTFTTCEIIENNAPLRAEVKAGDHLLASYAVSPKLYSSSTSNYRFWVEVSSGTSTETLFDRTIDPSRTTQDRGWQDADIDLSRYAGSSVILRFAAERIAWWRWRDRPDEVYWGGIKMVNAMPNPNRVNVVFVSIDTLRADHTSIYGYRRPLTPALDRIAAEGVWFHDAIAQSSWTKPSHMSMMTGLLPSYHGLWLPYRIDQNEKELSTAIPTLAELLSAHGILTQAFTASGNLAARFGFSRGFRRYEEIDASQKEDGPWVFGSAERWIEQHKDQPFFIFIHTFEAHRPFRHSGLVGDKMNLVDQYDSSVQFTDGLIDELDKKLDGLGLRDRTLLIITSDHGEELTDRDYWSEHSHTLYDEILRVPLVFRLPGRFRPRQIARYQAQHVDLLPTILDILKIDRSRLFLQGHDLVPILEGARPPATSTVISEGTYFGGGDLRSLRYQDRGLHKLIYSPSVADGTFRPQSIGHKPQNKYWMTKVLSSHGREFYDLGADTKERDDLSPRDLPLMKQLLGQLQVHLSAIAHKPVPNPETVVETDGIDSDLKDELRSLGY